MLYVNIKDIPWREKEFPRTFIDTVADIAIETYSFTDKDVSISCNDQADVDRLIAMMNILTSSREYVVVNSDGPIKTIGKRQPAIGATTPTRATPIADAPQPVRTPIADLIAGVAARASVTAQEMVEPPHRAHGFAGEALARLHTGEAGMTLGVDTFNPGVYTIRAAEPEPAPRSMQIIPVGNHYNRYIDMPATINRIPDDQIESTLYSRIGDTQSNNYNEISRLKARYKQFYDELVLTMRKINELSELPKNSDTVKSVISQVRAISNNMPDNKITDCYITNKYIVFKTSEIHALDSSTNKKHNLGRIMITMSLDGLMFSGTGRVSDCGLNLQPLDHLLLDQDNSINLLPHVREEGTCFGNMTEMIVEAFAKRDVITLLDLAIRFVENPNMDDILGKSVKYWPVVEEAQ